MTCTLCEVEPPKGDEPSIRRVVDGAQKALKAQAKAELEKRTVAAILDGDVSMQEVVAPSSDMETGKIIGIFEASFLGTAAVKDFKGEQVVNKALEDVLKLKSSDGVFVQVGTEGVKTIDSLTQEITMSYVIKDISYTTVAGRSRDVFAFIQKDDSLNMINCHLFKCGGERAFDVATAFGEAFKAFAEEQKKIGGNPFQPYGPRDTPPADLFKKQVHRIDLVPRKPIGAGQFGQVYLALQTVADGTGQDGGNKWDRAVKMLRGGASEMDREDFTRESQVMLDLQHENLVQLIGVSMQQKPWLMVLEFLQYGDLRTVLKGFATKGLHLTYSEQLTITTKVHAYFFDVHAHGQLLRWLCS